MSAVHSASAASLYVPYIRPGETGSRSDVHWLLLDHEMVRKGSDALRIVDSLNDVHSSMRSPIVHEAPSVSTDPVCTSSNAFTVPTGLCASGSKDPTGRTASVSNDPADSSFCTPKESTVCDPSDPTTDSEFKDSTIPIKTNECEAGWDISPAFSTRVSMDNLDNQISSVQNTARSTKSQYDEDGTWRDRNAIIVEPMKTTAYKYLSRPAVRISSQSKFNFSILEYLTEDLEQATHSAQLESKPRSFLSLNLDPFLMGVGGDDSWTACVHEEFLLRPKIYEAEFSFQFFDSSS